ncbi:DUF6233 domain-containing protein [Streptomyces sp. NPDC057686]|uniref:DUF6233 domain-containing protein n=1 Tax=Streptomyces sp. NPDC057686 TaxID=3346212 RepID=UPI0036A41DEB
MPSKVESAPVALSARAHAEFSWLCTDRVRDGLTPSGPRPQDVTYASPLRCSPVSSGEARRALAEGVPTCPHCRPEAASECCSDRLVSKSPHSRRVCSRSVRCAKPVSGLRRS